MTAAPHGAFPRRRKGCGRSGGDSPRRPPAPSRLVGSDARGKRWGLPHDAFPRRRKGVRAIRRGRSPPSTRPFSAYGKRRERKEVGRCPTPRQGEAPLHPRHVLRTCQEATQTAPRRFRRFTRFRTACGSTPQICANLRNLRFPFLCPAGGSRPQIGFNRRNRRFPCGVQAYGCVPKLPVSREGAGERRGSSPPDRPHPLRLRGNGAGPGLQAAKLPGLQQKKPQAGTWGFSWCRRGEGLT